MSKKKEASTVPDIQQQIADKRKEMVNMRIQMIGNQLKDVKAINKTRREIARLLTMLNQQARSKS